MEKKSRYPETPYGELDEVLEAADEDRPTVRLIGGDGNAFTVIGKCHRAARKAGWSDDRWQKVRDEMMAGNYDHLLGTAMKYFDVD